MLDNDANRPPLELRLPDELARCESMLSSLSLPPSRVQRDDLMYRAGWAAAEAGLPVSAPQGMEQASSARCTYRRRTLAWSLTSAVLAASLAVAITANFPGSAAMPQAVIPETRSSDRPEMSVEAAPPSAQQAQPIPRKIARTTAVDWTAPLLVMRDRAPASAMGRSVDCRGSILRRLVAEQRRFLTTENLTRNSARAYAGTVRTRHIG